MTKSTDLEFPLLSRRHFVIGAVLAGASGLAFNLRPEVVNPVIPSDTFEGWVPSRVGPWREVAASGVVLPPPDTLRDRLYDNLVTRVYTAQGLPTIMLLLAYNNAQDGVLQVHRPEVCYPVGGFALSETLAIPLILDEKVVPANAFIASGPDRTEQVIYFTRLGGAFPRTWFEQRVAVMNANLRGEIPDGMLMRVSVLGSDQATAKIAIAEFAQNFYLASKVALRRLMVA